MIDKRPIYNELVVQRKECTLCADCNFANQSSYSNYDTKEIGNWTTWANKLDADVMIIGQDYANQKTFRKDKGKIEPEHLNQDSVQGDYSTPTNYTLRELTKIIGYDIGLPTQTSNKKIFLTNSTLCLKPGSMSDPIPVSVYKNCGDRFLARLIKLISPKAIITLGLTATKATIFALRDNVDQAETLGKAPFSKLFLASPIRVNGAPYSIFPVYHPGSFGIMNRRKMDLTGESGWELQKEDWLKIEAHLSIL